jgi:hypothetical protein
MTTGWTRAERRAEARPYNGMTGAPGIARIMYDAEIEDWAAFVQAGMPVPLELLTGVFGVGYGWRLVLRRGLDVIDYKDFRRTGLWF